MTKLSARLSDLWHGKIPLVHAFWFYLVILPIFFICIFAVLTAVSRAVIVIGPLILIGFGLLFVAYNIIAIVGVWRSANKYKGAQLWAVLARVGAIYSAVELVAMVGISLQVTSYLLFA